MIILAIRTDKPEAEIGLFDGNQKIGYKVWQAHRELSDTLHVNIIELLRSHKKNWSDLGGIVVYMGPGSFTGLRIGVSVANALAYSLTVPIVGAMTDSWCIDGVQELLNGRNSKAITPEYGSEAHITMPKK